MRQGINNTAGFLRINGEINIESTPAFVGAVSARFHGLNCVIAPRRTLDQFRELLIGEEIHLVDAVPQT